MKSGALSEKFRLRFCALERTFDRSVSDQYSLASSLAMALLLHVIIMLVLALGVNGFIRPGMTSNNKPRIASRQSELYMGGKQAKFGVFSPVVYAVKAAMGEGDFNKLRGKGISLHSQVITEFCQQYGAYNLRLKLIKKAKKNGDILGFLV